MMGEVIKVAGKAPDIGEFLKDTVVSQKFADVTLCCPGGQRFLAHKLVLSAASRYLQDVLLAHSKSTSHCEPITVILAEVEAPELAAILGFIYTGSASVPRTRLNAFLHAAETLRIQLPPVPIVVTCSNANCKQEDIKDVKISTKYLQCEQYPLYEQWYQSNRYSSQSIADTNMGCCSEKLSIGIAGSQTTISSVTNSEFRCNFGKYYRPINWRLNPVDIEYSPKANAEKFISEIDGFDKFHLIDQNIDSPTKLDIAKIDSISNSNNKNSISHRYYNKSFAISEFIDNLDEKSPSSIYSNSFSNDSSFSSIPYNMKRLDSQVVSLHTDCEEISNSDVINNTCESPLGRLSIDRKIARIDRVSFSAVDSTFRERDSRYEYIEGSVGYDEEDYAMINGEDLTCRESCCGWRTPRRYVANRVTASPWRQISRPHHSPKIHSVAARLEEVTENDERLSSSEPQQTEHDEEQSPVDESRVGDEVPYALRQNRTSPEARTRPEFLSPRLPPFSCNTIASVAQRGLTPSSYFPSPAAVSVRSIPTENTSFIAQIAPRSVKVELSHPVSRLCDSLGSRDAVFETKIENEAEIEEKNLLINSDSNNNDAIVDADQSLRTRTSEEHKCDQCGKSFVTRASLKVHGRTHSGEKPFRCVDCGKQFSQLRNYKYHRSVHEGTREFAATCPECGKYFNDRGYLSSHMKIHRNRKEYGCTECGKSFNQRVAYNMHVRIHTGVKPHQCDQCGKAFSRKMLLKQHLRTHSGERPYQCQVCHKAFADRSNMTLHTRLHSGLKPYQCTLCSKAFTKKHHLKTHLNYHTGTKPYSCPNCGLRFSQSSNMRTHYKKCTLNNPNGVTKSTNVESSQSTDGIGAGTPHADTLTPPNSDQESSVLTPLLKTVPVNVESAT